MSNYTHLSLSERHKLSILLQKGLSIRQIAKRLNRHRTTLYREIARHRKRSGTYNPFSADKSAQVKRTQQRCCKIEKQPQLQRYIREYLKLGWSPEQIAGRLKYKNSKYVVCHETIYRYIYRKKNKKLFSYLPRKKRKRCRQFARKSRACRFGNNRLITARSKYITNRHHYGHWEGDRIEFKGDKSKAVTTIVERKTRVVLLIKNISKETHVVMSDIKEKFIHMSHQIFKSITFDQGNEFANYALLEKHLKCQVFYCHRHAPWEKGSNENMNGRIRRYLPFKCHIDEIHQELLDELSRKLNNTPRKCLGFRTPKELFLKHYGNDCRAWF